MDNKSDILREVLIQIEKEKHSLQESIDRCKNEIEEAPGPMVSHSDTTRHQVGQQLMNLTEHLEKLESAEKFMRESSCDHKDGILSVGCIAEIEVDGKNRFVFIVPNGVGGITVGTNTKISIISELSPMSQAILGKKIGDDSSFKVNGLEKQIKILKI